MNIAIVNSTAGFLNFYVNLARYLIQSGYKVSFINPDKFIQKQLKKYKIHVFLYSKTADFKKIYDENSGLVQYYSALFKIKNKKTIVSLKNTEYLRAFRFFNENKFDKVLIFNGAMNVETDVCKNLNLNAFYFEQGYFPNTMQMDAEGVNCNASFTNLSFNEFIDFNYPKNEPIYIDFKSVNVKYSLFDRYFLRFLNSEYRKYFFNFFIRNLNLYRAKKRFKNSEAEKLDLESIGKYIFFPLQVNTDTQILLNSPYINMYEAIDDVLPDLLKTGLTIIIKEHPFEVEPVDYSMLQKHKQVILLKKADINQLIEHSEFLVNVNSSVGLQAITKYKKVLLLGDSFYKNSPISVEYKNIKGKNLIEELNQVTIDKSQTDKYISHFKKEIFINGHIQNLSVQLFEAIRQRLV